MRVDRAERRGKRIKSANKSNRVRRKAARRRASFESSPWYQSAALAISAARSRD